MQRIIPCLWFDGKVQEAADFYADVFKAKVTRTDYYSETGQEQHGHQAGDILTIEVEIDGTRIMILNGGPYFTINPSISLSVKRANPDEVNEVCAKLLDGGAALMQVDTYPFNERYGWIQDKFGMSWQISVGGPSAVVPSLLFTQDKAGRAEEAMNFYASVFPDSSVGTIARYEAGQEPDAPGSIMYGEVSLMGQTITAMDSAQRHDFVFSEGVSLLVECRDQAEIDEYWDKLSVVPESEQCGWLKDTYGVSWQIAPTALNDMLTQGTQEQIEKVMAVFMDMKKIDIATLERAYNSAN